MNIFYLDVDPKMAAKYQCDKHVVKMCVETAQLLSNACTLKGFAAPYRLTHKNHPDVKWLMQSSKHYDWLCLHFESLCSEYTFRYKKIHACAQHIDLFYRMAFILEFPSSEWSDPPRCMPIEYKLQHKNVVDAYRAYYRGEKAYFAKWRMGNMPEWFAVVAQQC